MNEKSKEQRLRKELLEQGYTLKKSRIKKTNFDNCGGYMIVNTNYNYVEAGSRYDLTLEDVEEFLKDETEDQKSKCTYCGFIQADSLWKGDADFEHDGKFVLHPIGGDHARCPGCNRLVHIDYDLDEVK